MSSPAEELTDHMYDGIQEYDNPLPGWWVWLFLLTIVVSPIYWAYYHFGTPGRSIYDDYADAVASNLRQQFSEIGELKPDRDTLLKYLNDKRWLAVGESVYKVQCVSCHGTKGEGKVGPNLCDDHWKNVKQIEDVAKVVAEGAAGRAMPAWANRLHPNELVLVSCYVASLRGSLPAGEGKTAEGNVIPPWTQQPATP
jgi:cytochrome c oxidase cbb3-type subunit III